MKRLFQNHALPLPIPARNEWGEFVRPRPRSGTRAECRVGGRRFSLSQRERAGVRVKAWHTCDVRMQRDWVSVLPHPSPLPLGGGVGAAASWRIGTCPDYRELPTLLPLSLREKAGMRKGQRGVLQEPLKTQILPVWIRLSPFACHPWFVARENFWRRMRRRGISPRVSALSVSLR